MFGPKSKYVAFRNFNDIYAALKYVMKLKLKIRPMSAAHKAKISAATKGRRMTDEHKAKLSAAKQKSKTEREEKKAKDNKTPADNKRKYRVYTNKDIASIRAIAAQLANNIRHQYISSNNELSDKAINNGWTNIDNIDNELFNWAMHQVCPYTNWTLYDKRILMPEEPHNIVFEDAEQN